MRSSPIGFRPRSPFGESGCRRSTSRAHGTTCSISAKNLSRRVRFFLPAYSACEKLPCRCIVPPLGPPGPPDSTRSQNPQPTLFQCFPSSKIRPTPTVTDVAALKEHQRKLLGMTDSRPLVLSETVPYDDMIGQV